MRHRLATPIRTTRFLLQTLYDIDRVLLHVLLRVFEKHHAIDFVALRSIGVEPLGRSRHVLFLTVSRTIISVYFMVIAAFAHRNNVIAATTLIVQQSISCMIFVVVTEYLDGTAKILTT